MISPYKEGHGLISPVRVGTCKKMQLRLRAPMSPKAGEYELKTREETDSLKIMNGKQSRTCYHLDEFVDGELIRTGNSTRCNRESERANLNATLRVSSMKGMTVLTASNKYRKKGRRGTQ